MILFHEIVTRCSGNPVTFSRNVSHFQETGSQGLNSEKLIINFGNWVIFSERLVITIFLKFWSFLGRNSTFCRHDKNNNILELISIVNVPLYTIIDN